MAESARKLDPYGNELAPEGLYRYDKLADHVVNGFEAVTDDDIAFYQTHGYLVVENAFTQDEIRTTFAAFLDLISRGEAVQFERSVAENVDELPIEEKQKYIRKLGSFLDSGDSRFTDMSEHPKLLSVCERMVDGKPELYAHQAFWKPPGGREKPWHQDKAYFPVPIGTPVVGVWIALDEATPENGCMHIIPGSHQEGPVIHFKRRDWQICDTDVPVQRDTMVPLKPGGVLFFNGMIHHGTPPNNSPHLRRSMQFHYVPAGTKRTSQEERLAIWGSEGKDVEC